MLHWTETDSEDLRSPLHIHWSGPTCQVCLVVGPNMLHPQSCPPVRQPTECLQPLSLEIKARTHRMGLHSRDAALSSTVWWWGRPHMNIHSSKHSYFNMPALYEFCANSCSPFMRVWNADAALPRHIIPPPPHFPSISSANYWMDKLPAGESVKMINSGSCFWVLLMAVRPLCIQSSFLFHR